MAISPAALPSKSVPFIARHPFKAIARNDTKNARSQSWRGRTFNQSRLAATVKSNGDFHDSKLPNGAARNGAADSGKAPQISGKAGKRKGAASCKEIGD